MRSISEGLAVGDYLSPFAMQRNWHNHFYNFIKSDFSTLKLESAPETVVEMPEATALTENLASHKGQLVKITSAKISRGSTTTDEPAALSDEPESETSSDNKEWIMTTAINDVDVILPITAHLGWTPEGITEDNDDEFIVTGVVMPRTTLTDPNAEKEYDGFGNVIEVKADDSKLELWVTGVEVRRRTATPVIALSGEESNVDGVAVATETVTVTITSEEGAAIEYSLDGGTTWLPYTAPLAVDKSEQLSARAVLGDFRESLVAQQTIRFEYYSGDVCITVSDPMPGYTEVRMAPADASLADGSYTIRYTTDGSEPTATSTPYTAPLELEAATTIKAALFENAKDRQGKTAQQTVSTIKSGNVKISVTDTDKGTLVYLAPESNKHLAHDFDIFYAFEGGDGTWTRYTAAIHIAENCKIMAYMTEHGKTDGQTAILAVTGIANVGADNAAAVSVEGDSIVAPEGSQVFDLTGRRVRPEGLRAGIYIVRLPGGTAVKVAVK